LIVLNWVYFPLVYWVMVITWSTDICAYFAGRSIGGPKLAPRISPNKTWAGLIGGMAGAAVFGYIVAHLLELGAPFLYIGAAMGAISQGGDLYESWIKRRAGVKDSGTILPGHGGVLDRLDGLLPVVLATLALLMTGLWTG
jgi:phosphatidate cytidylyltransferase